MKWTAPASENGSPVTGYVVTPYLGGVARPVQRFPASPFAAIVTGLVNSSAYTFRVAATNANGDGLLSPASVQVVIGAPTSPTTVVAIPGNGAATITWHAPVSNNGSAVTHYLIAPYRNGVAEPVRTFGPTPLTQTLTGLANATPYVFRIAAMNARGTGISVATSAIQVGAPVAPTSVIATAGVASASVHWNAPSTNNGSAVNGYVVTPFLGGVAGTPQTFASNATTQAVTGLTTGLSYTFTVAASNARGVGPASAASNAVMPT